MEKKISISPQDILTVVKRFPESKKALTELFPSVIDSGKTFCKVGSVLIRKKYPQNFYALFKENGKVKLLNITCNKFWSKDRFLTIYELKDKEGQFITEKEFRELTGMKDISDFKVIS